MLADPSDIHQERIRRITFELIGAGEDLTFHCLLTFTPLAARQRAPLGILQP